MRSQKSSRNVQKSQKITKFIKITLNFTTEYGESRFFEFIISTIVNFDSVSMQLWPRDAALRNSDILKLILKHILSKEMLIFAFLQFFSFILIDSKRYFACLSNIMGNIYWNFYLEHLEYLLEQQNSDACFCKLTCLVQSVLCKEQNRKHFNQSRHLPHHVIALNFSIPSRDHLRIPKSFWNFVQKRYF